MRVKFHSRTLDRSIRYYVDKRSPQLMLLHACFFRTCINPLLIVHLYRPSD